MAEAWDLRSNIKAKPGSQGTLFGIGDKDSVLNPSQRWPRGYTPERKNEVTKALDHGTSVHGTDYIHPLAVHARVVDTISRSTMPSEHLRGLRSIEHTAAPGTQGVYYPERRSLHAPVLRSDQQENDTMGKVLIHELGHHHDSQELPARSLEGISDEAVVSHAQRTLDARREDAKYPLPAEPNATMRAQARVQVKSGRAEGYADNYMQEHYRTRGRNPQPVTEGMYEINHPEQSIRDNYPGYRDVRPKVEHLGPQFKDGHLF